MEATTMTYKARMGDGITHVNGPSIRYAASLAALAFARIMGFSSVRTLDYIGSVEGWTSFQATVAKLTRYGLVNRQIVFKVQSV